MILDKKHLEHLAALSRIEIKKGEEEKLLEDLRKILNHFEELKEVNTENVQPLSGGTELKNVSRSDEIREDRLRGDKAVEAFPEREHGYLKVPPVFSAEGAMPAGRQGSASGGE